MEYFATASAWFMDNATPVLVIAVTVTVLAEIAASTVRQRVHDSGRYDATDATTSVVSALAYLLGKGIVGKLLLLGVALSIYDNYRLFDLDITSPLPWIALLFIRDFIAYWAHRAEHRCEILWASHLVHHSSRQFSFTTAVRMPWMEAVYKSFLALWAPLFGFHPLMSAAVGAFVLMYGQFQHNEFVPRLGVLDRIFVTPTVHRVHHGSNPEYLDKNYGGIFVIWDRLFGTYAVEDAPVRYGLVGGKTIDGPHHALVGGYAKLAERVRSAGSPRAGLRLLFAPPS